MRSIEQTIGYVFRDSNLLSLALTHKSLGQQNNERLEYLGDAVLDLIVGEYLYQTFPDVDEQALTLMRSSLVKKTTLADMARDMDLGEHIRLGTGELKSGGFRRDSILADTLEAIIGAIYLDGGLDAVRQFSHQQIAVRAEVLDPGQMKDPKTRLQEHLQSEQLALPEYVVIATSGTDHAQEFDVECRLEGLKISTVGRGRSRRDAEKQAAEQALVLLNLQTEANPL